MRSPGGSVTFVTTWLALALTSAGCGALGATEQGERARASDTAEPAHGGESARSRPEGTLVIASWNLAWLNKKSGAGPVKRRDDDYARLRQYAERLDADVIALQEIDGVEAAQRVFDPKRYELYAAAQTAPQRTGFAWRKGLRVTVHPDYAALDVGQLRAGSDITVEVDGISLRLLSVHLKSGCFDDALTSSKKDCRKLAAQVPSLEAWIDARAAEGSAAAVLGDFNRRLFGGKPDELWAAIDDAEPPASDLWSPTEGRKPRCWDGEHALFIDHLVLNQPATSMVVADSFRELVYEGADASSKQTLSDHCPLALTLTRVAAGAAPFAPPHVAGATAAVDAGPAEQRIKGNVGSGGRKLYHAPGCPDYGRTEIDESKGERFFDTIEAAEAAGFVRSSNCPNIH
jgi:endonuclease/exonuclease/phosphatase family metal-dependent hydrolase